MKLKDVDWEKMSCPETRRAEQFFKDEIARIQAVLDRLEAINKKRKEMTE